MGTFTFWSGKANQLAKMSDSLHQLHSHLPAIPPSLIDGLCDRLSKTQCKPQEATDLSVKSIIQSLLSNKTSVSDFALACASLASARSSTHELLAWVPDDLSVAADAAFSELSRIYGGSGREEERLVVDLMPELVPALKDRIKESSIDKSDENDEISAASARVPVGFAIVAAYQFRWFVSQVAYPHLGTLVNLVVPCALTALDHWSPEVKGQGMISFIHLAKNVNAAELGWYEDVILDACCQNIASSDEIWSHAVEMCVLLVVCLKRSDPRSIWYERMLNEMLSHLERQPRNKERRTVWLKFSEPLFNAVGLILLAHFRRIFPLFFRWMHCDDDETVLLVLKRIHLVIRLTWIRNTPFLGRLVDELVVLYKEAALRTAREEIRADILHALMLLQQCKGQQFETAWKKHMDDLNLSDLTPQLSGERTKQAPALMSESSGKVAQNL